MKLYGWASCGFRRLPPGATRNLVTMNPDGPFSKLLISLSSPWRFLTGVRLNVKGAQALSVPLFYHPHGHKCTMISFKGFLLFAASAFTSLVAALDTSLGVQMCTTLRCVRTSTGSTGYSDLNGSYQLDARWTGLSQWRRDLDGRLYRNEERMSHVVTLETSWGAQRIHSNDVSNLWAPDCYYRNGEFLLYYSASSFGSRKSAILLAKSTSGNAGSWSNLGLVTSTTESND